MANSLVDVEGYITDEGLPFLENRLGLCLTCNSDYRSWGPAEKWGTRGQTFSKKLPTRSRVKTGITFDQQAVGEGDFTERRLAITADQEKLRDYQYTNIQEALYDRKGLLAYNNRSDLIELATEMEKYVAQQMAFTGYRAFGDFAVQSGQMQTVGEVTDAVATFQAFGYGAEIYYTAPLKAAAKIAQSALQQFVLDRNNRVARRGEMGELGGVEDTVFMKSNVLPTHTAGTASLNAANLGTGFQIDSVTPTAPSNAVGGNPNGTTSIDLSGMTPGETIVANDIVDIGFLSTDPLRMLTYTGYVQSPQTVQGRVVTGGTVDGSGDLTIVIEPALIYDATNTDVNANLNRDIVTGGSGDTLRVAKSHIAAPVYIGQYGFFVCPPLPKLENHASASVESPNGISLRMYYGDGIIGTATKWVVHDVLYGFKGAGEAFGRILYPID